MQLKYRPKSTDLVCSFYIEPGRGLTVRKAADRVASESSVGTWTEVSTMNRRIRKMGAKVFEIKGKWAKIAYPIELFEPGNMPQILSSIAGNIFGMKAVRNIRLEDVRWPERIMRSFPGPKYGIQGIRKALDIPRRPLLGTIIKPKIGLRPREHAKVAYEAWVGGCDIVKDDENLSNQSFNKFEARVRQTLRMRDRAEKETGERKAYMPNVTAETKEMIRRARFVQRHKGRYMMVDILTVGWSGLQTLRNENLNLILHAHRAGHAALTRNARHGISMLVIADIARLIGVDQLHIGTAVGKMQGGKRELRYLGEEIEKRFVKGKSHILGEDWHAKRPVFAVCSGGIYPKLVARLVKMLGYDIIIQAGGGIHGHPQGTRAGATAMRDAVRATIRSRIVKHSKKKRGMYI